MKFADDNIINNPVNDTYYCGVYDDSSSLNTKLLSIILEFNFYYTHSKKSVPINDCQFSDIEKDLIRQNSKIFFICNPKEAVLVKWILEESQKLFRKRHYGNMRTSTMYRHLNNRFGQIDSFNTKIKQLLDYKYSLTYDHFRVMCEVYLKEYNETVSELVNILNSIKSLGKQTSENHIPFVDETKPTDLCEISLKSVIGKINANNNSGRIIDLISAYTSETDKNNALKKLFNGYQFVSEISPDYFTNIGIYENLLLYNFIDWLSLDLKTHLYDRLNDIFNTRDKRHREMILARVRGLTLDAVGTKYGVTRERIRQIEKKYVEKFIRYYSKVRPQYILKAFGRNNGYFGCDEIENIYQDLSDIVNYLFKNKGPREIKLHSLNWIPELNGFVLGDDQWYEQLKEKIEEMPSVIDGNNTDDVISHILNGFDLPLEIDDLKRIILNYYAQSGDTYSKVKLSKKNIYLKVLEKFYPDGIKLYDDFEMMRFRNHVKDMFGEIELSNNNRAIEGRIAAITVLCDKGKYTLPENIELNEGLLSIIHDFILNNNRDNLAVCEVFKRFKSELKNKTNITNWYFLQGVLRHKYGDEFDFSRSIVGKNAGEVRSINAQVEDFVRNAQDAITKDEISKELSDIPEFNVNVAIQNNKNILAWGWGNYIHISKLTVNKETLEKTRNILDDCLSQGIVGSREVFEYFYAKNQEFMFTNGIDNHIALFSVLKYLLHDEYEFSRSFIAPKGSEKVNLDSVIREYLDNFNEIKASDLKAYLEDKHFKILNFGEILESISDEFLRADEDLLVRTSQFATSEETYKIIEENVKVLMGIRGYLVIRTLDNFLLFPYIGHKWNSFLLISLIKRFSKEFRIIKVINDYRYSNDIVVDSRTNVQNHDDLIHYALRLEDIQSPFKNIQEIGDFLRQQGLINGTIPQTLFSKGIIKQNESGIVQII